MVFADLQQQLRAEGFHATRGRIYRAIDTRKVDRPPMNGAGQYEFAAQHLDQLRDYLRFRPKRGRRTAACA